MRVTEEIIELMKGTPSGKCHLNQISTWGRITMWFSEKKPFSIEGGIVFF
jgi:hypothetical protein